MLGLRSGLGQGKSRVRVKVAVEYYRYYGCHCPYKQQHAPLHRHFWIHPTKQKPLPYSDLRSVWAHGCAWAHGWIRLTWSYVRLCVLNPVVNRSCNPNSNPHLSWRVNARWGAGRGRSSQWRWCLWAGGFETAETVPGLRS